MNAPRIAFALLSLAALLSVPLWGSSSLMRTLVEFISLLALAQLWNLLAGYTGLVSVGQQAWIGLGGYALIVFADDLGINLFLAVFLAGLFTAAVSLPTAALVFRLRAGYFAIGTWVVAEVFRLLVAGSTDWLKGGLGRTLAAAGALERGLREDLTYWLAVALGAGSIALVYGLMRSRIGLGLTAIRDSETAAASLGVNVNGIKWLVYVLCAFGTGVIGALIYLNVLRITPDAAFSVQWTAFMIFIVVIGGIGTVEGPIVGALVFFFIREYLAGFGGWSLILLGVIAVVMMLVAPQGIWGLIHERFGLEIFPVRRRLPASVPPVPAPEPAEAP
ncbi:MAG: branched-chain amino acid ABC transporter permease [Anaerolineales bacterium]|nr:branched-chain amino acid ABC transporter permease [Anaerolineales bacterium]